MPTALKYLLPLTVALALAASAWFLGQRPEILPARSCDSGPACVLVGDLLGAIEEHDVEPLIHDGAGQSVAFFNEIRTVQEVMDSLVAETEAVLQAQSGYLR